MYWMNIHDRRLDGETPRRRNFINLEVDQRWSMTLILSWVSYYVGRYGRLARLSILCHGYEDTSGRGGYGLQLGKDDLTLRNVNLWGGIYRKVNWLYVYSCAAADVAPGRRGTHGDGQLLCSRLAFYTGSYVRAGSATQWYQIRGTSREIDFGRWEGWVYTFAPNGAMLNPVWQPYD